MPQVTVQHLHLQSREDTLSLLTAIVESVLGFRPPLDQPLMEVSPDDTQQAWYDSKRLVIVPSAMHAFLTCWACPVHRLAWTPWEPLTSAMRSAPSLASSCPPRLPLTTPLLA